MKNPVLNKLVESGVVAVVRAQTKDEATKIALACIEGGLKAIELTFTVPNAHEVIRHLRDAIPEEKLILGAGTVLDKQTAQLAIESGATYIVSPGFDLETALYCNEVNVPYMPGCLTITEMLTALKAGVEVVKLFPGSAFGPSYVKAVKGPLPNINIMPTGGVSLDNVGEWIKNGVVAVGVGGELTAPAKHGDFDGVRANAKAFVDAVKKARG
ncbi:2-dehydro-3-deoxyphosphogluconate aldolase/(4S)-4-hydroxy-2-oxoglutarate aldolase [Acholeplasma morum]|jgi:2-dehydro-3-deoxyphosphogluconate aldolase/(4S)-4-hydroxy-2-oxoglutarate aldolase|uniref:bifunctional 2-keto-4-hydroxyglutarate aldolase/2-keto-3-deoxy-6-phosphogluconate aldolase n=1 Tax=Paracholeplasma morum TaxID=264637 RepID=UPI001958DC27|nr:bifunctional 2-keto-4-hydroxyglutarate aldolase/2-keto-3-deoxy-6-phosphogluconate aldolase [Paracholeplasma morum]MBM7453258.1 2-dehydro-3-deoxyphosphogluconate aldolase/(4S)-4-hydroxy-2-oxoglutarate aldolase [Paracholeplasma morum]